MAEGQTGLDRLEAWLAKVTQPIAFIGVLGMLIVSAVTVVDVTLRWLGVPRVSAMNEIVAMTFAVAGSARLPPGISSGGNLQIDIFARWVTGRLPAWLGSAGGPG